ncbi:MAG: hypothetical protein ACKOKG_15990, partial [Verrucomicrobiota bacterium]
MRSAGTATAAIAIAALGLSLEAKVLDDFNDNTKTGWTDFTFVPNFGLPTESGGSSSSRNPRRASRSSAPARRPR